ncbi:metalloregulator ArsR/SmtB family transcription factor [Azospirillum sp. TSO35-2]|uniref:ArsR/SmtB family transcription factor n=1 Tax=Azospirillum sp. TSO35-2 TaxID=716796 RepID=UPI000D61D9AB|nr:metalloregulator ArsR/SmtB family transcription factor [Azospirillum sp. TSO35-2]PWC31214.1 ArsR family transcriptional regulator [Azospirillum sp. TSO35-2]
MEARTAIDAFAALAQDTRLAVFRLLIKAGPNGLTAGEVANQVGVPASTLSHHLATLERAGLLRSWRVQRQIFYASDHEGTRRLIAFLTEECCQGRPELCFPDPPRAVPCGSAGCDHDA